MFFKPSVNSNAFPILEVGPGALPFEFSDIWLDRVFETDERLAQSGNSSPASGKPLVYYYGGKFPFKDKAFKYVVASHVLEHISWEEVPNFLSELQRVATAGYIELPRWTWELVNHIPTHLLTGDVSEGTLHLYKKSCSHDHNFFSTVLIDESANFRRYIEDDKDLFFCHLEWQGEIPIQLHGGEYPIARQKSDIASLLRDDCVRHCQKIAGGRDDIQDDHRNRSTFAALFRRVVGRLSQKPRLIITPVEKRRPVIGDQDLSKLLRCLACGQDIGVDFRCRSCGFKFKRTGTEYFPSYE